MKYFRFDIPKIDGKAIKYSPGWYGNIAVQMAVPEVLLYNDAEGYGIAQVEDVLIPDKPLDEITEEEANIILSSTIEADEVFFGQSLEDRQEWLPEAIIAELTEDQKKAEEEGNVVILDDDNQVTVEEVTTPAVLGKGGKIETAAVVNSIAGNLPKENEVYIPDNRPTYKAQFCPICHEFITYLPSNLIAKKLVMTCLNEHKVVITQENE